MLTLILGGARSGKSRFAQSLCPATARVAYIATCCLEDEEMRARAERHRQDRPPHWLTIEEPLSISRATRDAMPDSDIVLIDCLTVWLSNVMWKHRDCGPLITEKTVLAEINEIANLAAEKAIILVSNDVGGGIVPETATGRLFRDLHGLLNQRAATAADRVFLTVAGIPVRLKPLVREEDAL
jgi:adenosylcobinamide kinase/adenosylcobinamide-phosphate guanylyltransferase